MSKDKATELELGLLHRVVAEVLTKQIKQEATVEQEDGTKEVVSVASPAVLAAAIKFLKDNNITSDAQLDLNLNRVEEALKHKKKRGSSLSSMSPITASQETH